MVEKGFPYVTNQTHTSTRSQHTLSLLSLSSHKALWLSQLTIQYLGTWET
jgi:hypothetical protein